MSSKWKFGERGNCSFGIGTLHHFHQKDPSKTIAKSTTATFSLPSWLSFSSTNTKKHLQLYSQPKHEIPLIWQHQRHNPNHHEHHQLPSTYAQHLTQLQYLLYAKTFLICCKWFSYAFWFILMSYYKITIFNRYSLLIIISVIPQFLT